MKDSGSRPKHWFSQFVSSVLNSSQQIDKGNIPTKKIFLPSVNNASLSTRPKDSLKSTFLFKKCVFFPNILFYNCDQRWTSWPRLLLSKYIISHIFQKILALPPADNCAGDKHATPSHRSFLFSFWYFFLLEISVENPAGS